MNAQRAKLLLTCATSLAAVPVAGCNARYAAFDEYRVVRSTEPVGIAPSRTLRISDSKTLSGRQAMPVTLRIRREFDWQSLTDQITLMRNQQATLFFVGDELPAPRVAEVGHYLFPRAEYIRFRHADRLWTRDSALLKRPVMRDVEQRDLAKPATIHGVSALAVGDSIHVTSAALRVWLPAQGSVKIVSPDVVLGATVQTRRQLDEVPFDSVLIDSRWYPHPQRNASAWQTRVLLDVGQQTRRAVPAKGKHVDDFLNLSVDSLVVRQRRFLASLDAQGASTASGWLVCEQQDESPCWPRARSDALVFAVSTITEPGTPSFSRYPYTVQAEVRAVSIAAGSLTAFLALFATAR